MSREFSKRACMALDMSAKSLRMTLGGNYVWQQVDFSQLPPEKVDPGNNSEEVLRRKDSHLVFVFNGYATGGDLAPDSKELQYRVKCSCVIEANEDPDELGGEIIKPKGVRVWCAKVGGNPADDYYGQLVFVRRNNLLAKGWFPRRISWVKFSLMGWPFRKM